ncbi:MAG: Sulfate permease 2 [Thelocarpon superellum]|nr:MAG: Sulfate permease 2 [Thelocarpon superellum]
MAPRAGRIAAKVLGIGLSPQQVKRHRIEDPSRSVTRGESTLSLTTTESYSVDGEPTVLEWIHEITPTSEDVRGYVVSLFPFVHWARRYNWKWALGDVVAGITVGAVVVPQSMAYASLAELPPQYGLYSSFMGVLIYWMFATSKDITIGPVAVMSTITGNVVLAAKKSNPDIPPQVIASALAVMAGSVILFIGLIRCGWIVDFISLAAISAFMTGSAINIAVGQVPSLMGITGFNSRDATYQVFINILKHLGRTKLDAAMGLTALTMLYLIRIACHLGAKRWPNHRKRFTFIGTLRVAFVILLYVMISWLANRNHKKKPLFSILGNVPRGFQNAGVPTINVGIIRTFASSLPPSVIVLVIEHIAIAKSFGRINHYAIDPSQEMVATGLTNVWGAFLGAYPGTGSFSRTAINSKAGVRTPGGGLVTAIIVLLSIYALPAVFFYIPNASLSAVIIHAVGDLITAPDTVYQFWKVSPFEVVIFFAGVIVTVFASIEDGIYTTICLSVAMLLFRFAKARGTFLGKVKVHTVIGDRLMPEHGRIDREGFPNKNGPDLAARNVFLPIDRKDGSNPDIQVESPYPGIFIYRFSEGFNFPNASHYLNDMTQVIYNSTRRTDTAGYGAIGDRPWNDLGPRLGEVEAKEDYPTLQSIILDFSSVNHVDVTSIQHLVDVRNELDRWAAPDSLEWHIACISNRWTRRALVHAGFGYPTPDSPQYHRWKPVFSVAEMGGVNSAANVAGLRERDKLRRRRRVGGSEISSRRVSGLDDKSSSVSQKGTHRRLSSVDEGDDLESGHRLSQLDRPPDQGIQVETTIGVSEAPSVPGRVTLKPVLGEWDRDPDNLGISPEDLEKQLASSTAYAAVIRSPKVAVVSGLDRPLFHIVDGLSRPMFHISLTSALQSAIHNVELKQSVRRGLRGGSGKNIPSDYE